MTKNFLNYFNWQNFFCEREIVDNKKGEESMKKIFGATIVMFFVVVALAGTSYAWQGRMAGMRNPKGLIGDESDFLIHPAKIVAGQGIKYYLDYQFTYTDLIHWDSKLTWYNPGGVGIDEYFHNNASSAQQYDHNSLIGAAFPLGKGRMGVFFTYDKQMGDFDGDTDYDGEPGEFDADSHLDNYALSLIYGLPLRNLDLGLELGFAYRSEEQQESFQTNNLDLFTKNNVWPWEYFDGGFFPFMIPYDSSYWELLGKAGVKKKLNAVDIDWSVRGGYILSSDSENRYENIWEYSPGGNEYHAKANGDVRGYRIGSDLWIRRQVNDGLSLPFLVSVEYTKKDRDGDGYGTGFYDSGDLYQYEHITRTFEVKAGGGIEKEVKGCGRVGVGLYYNYLQSRDDLWFDDYGNIYNNTSYPYHREHRLVLNLAGEQVVSSDFTLRGGLDFFYGWVVSDDYKAVIDGGDPFINLPLDGRNWGIGASLGASKKFSCLTLEPFLKAGYREFDVDEDGEWIDTGAALTVYPGTMEKQRSEWFLGAGFSLLFGK